MKNMNAKANNIIIIAAGIVFAFLALTGVFYDISGGEMTVVSFFQKHFNSYAIVFAILSAAFVILFKMLFARIDRSVSRAKVRGVRDQKLEMPVKSWLIISAVIFLLWMPYLVIMFPGMIGGTDYFWQIMQGCGALPLSNHHPVFSTIIFAILYKTGYFIGGAAGGILLTCLVQMILMSLALGFCLSIMWELGIPRAVLVCILAVLCLCPVFPTHAMWAIKDSVFSSIAVMFFFCSFLYIWGKKNDIKVPKAASIPALTVMAILFSIYRNGTLPVALLQIAVIAIVCFSVEHKEGQGHRKSIGVIISLCTVILVTSCWSSFLDARNVYPTNFREMVGIPSRQLVKSLEERHDSFTDEELKAVEYVYRDSLSHNRPMEDIIASNSYETADYIKPGEFKSKEDIRAYIRLWISIGMKNPEIYADQALMGTYGYWWPGYDPHDVFAPTPTPNIHDYFENYDYKEKVFGLYFGPLKDSLQGNETILEQTADDYLKDYPMLHALLELQNANPKAIISLSEILMELCDLPVVSVFLTPGLYAWILLICFLYLLTRRKEGICNWPILAIIAMACLSPVNGYMRYVLSTDLFSIILIGICFLPVRGTALNEKID